MACWPLPSSSHCPALCHLGHVWEYATISYQQTRPCRRTSPAASAGAPGGAGSGIVAADTDMVFALCEELGLIVALCAVFGLILLAALPSSAHGRSSYYVIASCAAVSMILVQTALNVFGSLDILPFTGVTFPFVSRGGSSLISCWALLAFIKAGDTRQNASFVVKPPSKYRSGGYNDEEYGDYEDGEFEEEPSWEEERE